MLFGYGEKIKDFKKLADDKRLFHAYLFFGEPETGKFLFANSLANYIENKKFDEPEGILRETLVISPPSSSDSVEERRESVGIDSVREVEKFLYQKPVFSSYRVVIIRDAEWLTDYAQNALLKILEEPPENGVVIATAKDSNVFLPPVVSRFSKIFFGLQSEEVLLDFIREYGRIKVADEESLIKSSFGRIGRLKNLIDGGQKDYWPKTAASRAISLEVKKDVFADKLVDEILEKEKKDPQSLLLFLEELVSLLKEKFSLKFPDKIKEIYQTIFHINSLNVNKRIQIKKIIWTIKSFLPS